MSVSVTKHENLVGGEWVDAASGEVPLAAVGIMLASVVVQTRRRKETAA